MYPIKAQETAELEVVSVVDWVTAFDVTTATATFLIAWTFGIGAAFH